MAGFVSLTCPSCGLRLQVTSDLETFACSYCGNELRVKRGSGVVSLQPVMDSLGRVESKLDRNTEEIRRLRIVAEIDELERSRAGILQTIAVQESTREIVHVRKKKHPVRGVIVGFFAVSLLLGSCTSLTTDTGSAFGQMFLGLLLAWWAMHSFGWQMPSRNARRLKAEADALSQSVAAKRRELEHR